MNSRQSSATPSPLLLTARAAAEFCGISHRTWRTWDAGGLVPRPVSIGRAKFWRSAELRAWVASGCLSRRMWDVLGGAEKV
jgi:predicted DNA-binding transcriptional regulator AlpA